MKRHSVTPRANWQERADEVGFTYHTAGIPAEGGDGTYWDESVAYEFTAREVDVIEEATEELHSRCLDAVDRIVADEELMLRMEIPQDYHDYIRRSWQRQDPSLYGRFDLAYDGSGPPKMLEYNADTPTMIIESALMQWFWLQDKYPTADQFNSLHEKLLERLGEIRSLMPAGVPFYFAGYEENAEENQTCKYLQDLAVQAGLDARFIDLSDIGWVDNRFVDLDGYDMRFWFKLYPWEWMFKDDFGRYTITDCAGIVEPVWKCVLSNKGILPILHEMFPDHPNILPARWVATEMTGDYVAKPLLSREGANIDIVSGGHTIDSTDGIYLGRRIYQQRSGLFRQGDNYAVIGSWVVGNKAAGMIIRDHDREIVRDRSRVVPHWFI